MKTTMVILGCLALAVGLAAVAGTGVQGGHEAYGPPGADGPMAVPHMVGWLVDEVLSAGDLNFQHKARARMREMMARAHLFVMVSHDLDSLQKLCERLVWLDHGRVRRTGPGAEIIAAYRESARPAPLAA